MPLLGSGEYKDVYPLKQPVDIKENGRRATLPGRSRSHQFAPSFNAHLPTSDGSKNAGGGEDSKDANRSEVKMPAAKVATRPGVRRSTVSSGSALTDTPATTAPSSPIILPIRRDSGSVTPSNRARPTTLDIPGLTKSKVSPDGKIAQRDVGAKLVIIMVGLPARGKSYITKKVARYLNWLQHDTRIFNVGERRRVAAATAPLPSPAPSPGTAPRPSRRRRRQVDPEALDAALNRSMLTPPPSPSTQILVNGEMPSEVLPLDKLPPAIMELGGDYEESDEEEDHDMDGSGAGEDGNVEMALDQEQLAKLQMPPPALPRIGSMDQTADFFDPSNERAAQIREEVALATLDELLDYVLDQGGSVGIFDATNSTLERRKLIVERIRQRAGLELNVLFLESLCIDENLLESNMRLKLSGPDYRDQDPVTALQDFKKRVAMYEKKYVALGEYEEKNNMPYIQMIDVGRKVVSHQIRGFLSAQTCYYLLNFNLAPRQIWITRHGESLDNVSGKIGGDSDLSEKGQAYAKALANFVKYEREVWEIHEQEKALSTHFPPQPGDMTPPNPDYHFANGEDSAYNPKHFCVWTSMLKRSVQTAHFFDEEEYEVKQMKMLDELNAGLMEGLTYEEIKSRFAVEYETRKSDKLHYRYPGAGGEGYLDVINRLRAVIVEAERMTDHLLLVCHRSVARVLLAYFKGLQRDDVASLDVPLGMLYMLEPKPYGVEFKAYCYNPQTEWFDFVPNYELRPGNIHATN